MPDFQLLAALPNDSIWMYASLVGLGVVVGVLTGIFGVGGAFLTVPFMISLLAIDPTLAVGCTMAFSMLTGTYGFYGHFRKGNVEPSLTLLLGLVSAAATFGGKWMHDWLKAATGENFEFSMKILLLGLLLPLSVMIWLTANKNVKPLLTSKFFKIPPLIDLRRANVHQVSLTLIVIFGVGIGFLKGLTAIGAGVILVPILIWAIGLPPHMAVGTSLGSIVISSLAGVIAYSRTGNVNWFYVAALLVGGLAGTFVGLKIVSQIRAPNLKKYFALVLLVVALFMVGELIASNSRG